MAITNHPRLHTHPLEDTLEQRGRPSAVVAPPPLLWPRLRLAVVSSRVWSLRRPLKHRSRSAVSSAVAASAIPTPNRPAAQSARLTITSAAFSTSAAFPVAVHAQVSWDGVRTIKSESTIGTRSAIADCCRGSRWTRMRMGTSSAQIPRRIVGFSIGSVE
ncbi:hypothetical protein BDD12DRAFT_855311 [Trichophaea hybrida]|nr:hypothetical protein BDD12DRAFT_855311 [Trichophaea hybrida]